MSECGKPAGYQRHQRNNEDPCDECQAAWNDYVRDYRDRTGKTTTVRVPLVALGTLLTCVPESVVDELVDEFGPGVVDRALRAVAREVGAA